MSAIVDPRHCESLNRLSDFRQLSRRIADGGVLVITGAGCSTASGIPDYRDDEGGWKRSRPIQFQDFLRSAHARRRYWARSLIGWRHVGSARPGIAHAALAGLERAGKVRWLITQNVDGLHQAAGSRRVTDLHGRLHVVRCLACDHRLERGAFQQTLVEANPGWARLTAPSRPDGDVDLDGADFAGFHVPACPRCQGLLKPDVVFFGENVPRPVVQAAFARLERSRLLLVAGSSLMVWSGYRFVRRAAELGIPVAIVNRGRTRGDGEAQLRLRHDCGAVLQALAFAMDDAVLES